MENDSSLSRSKKDERNSKLIHFSVYIYCDYALFRCCVSCLLVGEVIYYAAIAAFSCSPSFPDSFL